MRICSPVRVCLFVALILCCTGCSVFRAGASKKNLFLTQPEKQQEQRDRAPFNGVAYLDPVRVDALHATVKKICILPVRTDFIAKEIDKEFDDPDDREQRKEEVDEIAKYFTEKVKAAILAYPNYPYKLIENPEPESFVVEFALVELEPTSASVNVLAQIASFFVPGGGLLSRAASGVVAFEAQIRDGTTNQVIIEFKDRESDKTSPFSVKDFQMYGHVRRSIDEWAEQYAELSSTARTHRVSDSLPFSINPL